MDLEKGGPHVIISLTQNPFPGMLLKKQRVKKKKTNKKKTKKKRKTKRKQGLKKKTKTRKKKAANIVTNVAYCLVYATRSKRLRTTDLH